jgi:SAM-dependent methyltransferase
MRSSKGVIEARRRKMEKIAPLLRRDMPFTEDPASGGKVNYLTQSLRDETKIVDTENVSGWPYDAQTLAVVEAFPDGIILDCGAGLRPVYYENVVNYEIVDYDTSDVVGVGEHLPFHDNSFDAILSLAVLEHVRDPFQCANEICRVLKPGGKLFCSVPFLQPLHGYPHHYFNATHQGLRRLFEDRLVIERVSIPFGLHPIFALQWIVNSWANGLSGHTRQDFMNMRMGDVMADPTSQVKKPFVVELGEDKCFELACGNVIEARKPC